MGDGTFEGEERPSRVRLIGAVSSGDGLHPESWYRTEPLRFALSTRAPVSARSLVRVLDEEPETTLVGYHLELLTRAGYVDALPQGSGASVGRSYRYALTADGIAALSAPGPSSTGNVARGRWVGLVAHEIARDQMVDVGAMYKRVGYGPRVAFARLAAALLAAGWTPGSASISLNVDADTIADEASRWPKIAAERNRLYSKHFMMRAVVA